MANKKLLAKLANAGVIPPGEAVRMADYQSMPRARRRSFAGAQVSNLTHSMTSTPKPIDVDIRNGLRKLRARARNEAQNNDHVRRFLGLVKTNVVGHQGIVMQPRIIDPGGKVDVLANEAVLDAWKGWGKKGTCDVTGAFSWRMAQRLFIETLARDGEALIRRVRGSNINEYGYALQFLDSEALDVEYNRDGVGGKNTIRMGVELNEWRRPVAYHISQSSQTNESYVYMGRRYTRIPADEIFHAFLPEWVWQTRGFPWISSALLRLNMLSGYEESELVASRVGAAKMGFFEQKDEAPFDPTGNVSPMGSGEKDAQGNFVTDAEAGTFEILPEGYSLNTFDPQHPNSAYGEFVKSCLRGISGGLGVSYNSLANDLEGVNYSSLRQGALDERAVWMALQDWMVEVFCEPVFLDWLHTSLLSEAITVMGKPLPSNRAEKFKRNAWQPRRWQWVDPQKEMAGHEKAFAHKVRSPQSVIRDMGEDPDQVLDEWSEWEKKLRDRNLQTEPAPPAGSSVTETGKNATKNNQN